MMQAQPESQRFSSLLTDEDVVRRVVEGDAAQFEILIRRNNQKIYRAVRAVLRDDEDVEDVMQQAYLNAFSHIHQFVATAKFSSWLTRIALNAAFARRKKRGGFRSGEEGLMLSIVDTRSLNPEQEALTTDLRRVLEAEVASLPDALRLVFMLRAVEGMSTSETADALAVSEDVVKTRLHRARTELRTRLSEKAGITLETMFEFGNSRCDRIVRDVMEQIQRMP